MPQSRPRHRRRPSPRSYHGALRPQRPQRRETPLRGRTRATTSSTPSAPSSSNSMSSITVRLSTPNSPRHNLTLRTSLPAPLVPDLRQARNLKRQRRAPSQISNPPTEVSEEPHSVPVRLLPIALRRHYGRHPDGRCRFDGSVTAAAARVLAAPAADYGRVTDIARRPGAHPRP